MIRLLCSYRNYHIRHFVKKLNKALEKRVNLYKDIPEEMKKVAFENDPVIKIAKEAKEKMDKLLGEMGVR